MNKKNKTAYVCNSCGQDYAKWQGKCDSCGTWDSITEIKISANTNSRTNWASKNSAPTIVSLAEFKSEQTKRIPTAFSEIDRVLGGGVVGGAMVLLGGDPGVGKSTLLLQMMGSWAKRNISVVYVSGEESAEQIAMRASRMQMGSAALTVLTETSIENILSTLEQQKPNIAVIDSIQTMFSESLESAPGSVSQIREATSLLLRYAKTSNTAIFLIGHVTKEGAIAGPRVLEHMVDTVIYFEGDSNYNYRILRTVKNRFGPSGEIALLSMSDRGLVEVKNASEYFLMNREHPQVGTSVVPIFEGSRVLVVELQALVNRSHFGLPQRVASGINPRKLSLLLAVLERHGGLMMGDHDVFFNIAGGLTVSEPSIDLGVAASIVSSFRNKPIRRDIAFIGEVGLGGEVRPVNNMAARLKELDKMGFTECVVTRPSTKADWCSGYSLKLLHCSRIADLSGLLF